MKFIIVFFLTVYSPPIHAQQPPEVQKAIKKSDALQKKEEAKEIKLKESSPTNVPIAEKEERRDTFNLTAYNPIYFIYNDQNSKAQASFKYSLLRDYDLYLAYTHLILWDVNGPSRPFLDVNYNPELFYRWQPKSPNHIEYIDVIPYGHASNGRESLDSRSMNYLGGQINFKFHIKQNRVFRTGIKLRYLGNFDEPNRELRKYYGPVEIKFALTEFRRGLVDKGEISGRIYTGGTFGEDFSKGGQEIGLSFRILGLDITPAFYIQYFRGYSESLRYFDQKESIIRFGLLL